MSLNLIDIIILGILGLSIVSGMYKGFLASLLALAVFVGAWFGAMNVYPQISGAVQANEGILSSLQSVLDAEELFGTTALGDTLVAGASTDVVEQAVQTLNIPMIGDLFRSNVLHQAFVEQGLTTFTDYLTQTLLISVLNVLCFVLSFAVIYFALLLIVNLLNSVFRFPQLKHLDWLLGGAFGIVRGAAILFLLFALLPTATGTLTGMGITQLNTMLAESSLATYFGETSFLSPTFQWLIENIM